MWQRVQQAIHTASALHRQSAKKIGLTSTRTAKNRRRTSQIDDQSNSGTILKHLGSKATEFVTEE